MVFNENAGCLEPRGVLDTIASMLAPTGFSALAKLVANSYNSTQGQRAFPHLAF